MVRGYYDGKGRFHGEITSYIDRFSWFDCNCSHKKGNHYWCSELGEIKCEAGVGFFRSCNCKTHYCEGTMVVEKK